MVEDNIIRCQTKEGQHWRSWESYWKQTLEKLAELEKKDEEKS
jgi:hypothetical protein